MRSHRGFSLVELVMVMVLVGIIATIAVGRFSDGKESDAALYANRIATMMRYGQKLAIAQQRPVYVSFSTDLVTGEARAVLCYTVNCSSQVPAPGGMNSGTSRTTSKCVSSSWYCEAQPSGITVSYNATSPIFWFSPSGMPFDYRNPVTATTSTYSQINFSSSYGSVSYPVLVEPVTGYVH